MRHQLALRPAVRARWFCLCACAGVLAVWSLESLARDEGDLADLSLQQLTDVEVTSVSKTAELLSDAPASIYVITHDEILRSGVTSIAAALRLAPNLHVAQYTSSRYVAGARGFAGAEEAQNFSNKLLILVDGRTVYSPLFSGVYLDSQDVLLEDIDRIEVISGPGATLWGANAMHGVINIITRPAYLTQGTVASVGVGTQERNIDARYGGKLTEQLAFRVYGKAFERDQMKLAGGGGAQDDWSDVQGGARFDWTGPYDTITLQSDAYRAWEGQPNLRDLRIQGANALGRWQRHTTAGTTQLQLYVDQTERAQPVGGLAFEITTYDLELQQSAQLGRLHRIVWGAGARLHDYDIENTPSLAFMPANRHLKLGNAFIQDTVALADDVHLTVGLKLEKDPFADWEPLPDVRLAWQLSDRALLWASGSRAIRSATPFDHDVQEDAGFIVLAGNEDFKAEQVNTYEIGYRAQPLENFSLSASAFYNDYDDLRTIEFDAPRPGVLLSLHWDNRMKGETHGIETWAKWQVTPAWRLSPGFRWLHKDLKFRSNASGLLGVAQSGNDPKTQALLTSSLDLAPNISFDATLRYVDKLPQPQLSSYCELNASLQWHISRSVDVLLSGFNLLDASHLEYPAPAGERIRRSVLAQVRWRQ